MHAAGKDGLRMHTTFCRKPVLEPYEITHVNVPRLGPSQADWYSIYLLRTVGKLIICIVSCR